MHVNVSQYISDYTLMIVYLHLIVFMLVNTMRYLYVLNKYASISTFL